MRKSVRGLATVAAVVMAVVVLPATPALAWPTNPCDPRGTTSYDAALASQLAGRMTGKLKGKLTGYKISCARMVVNAVHNRGLPAHAATIAVTTTIPESEIENINIEVDNDSLGLFQQRATWGSASQRLDPTWATNAFLNRMLALYPNSSWLTTGIGTVCQAIQVSAHPERYEPEASDGRILMEALWPRVADTDGGPVQLADIDGDGRDELVSVGADGAVVAYRNRGWDAAKVYDGADYKTVAVGFTEAYRVRFADLTGDGRAELVSLNRDGGVVAYRNRGWDAAKVYDGADQRAVAAGFTDTSRVRLADLTGDGRAELVSVNPDGAVVAYRNLGWDAAKVYDGASFKTVATGFTAPGRTKLADLTGDDRAELLNVGGDGAVVAYRNLGWDSAQVYSGADQRTVASGFGNPGRIRLGDVTGDGPAELVTVGLDGAVTAYRNLGWTATKVYDGPENRAVASGFVY